ncbi:MAG: 4'-phosphopantetheinyl transferase superfamily protein [Ruminococcaceae bacterium]|nr:4'-phosphopantetheinyl transferase superfamily protein [Oscillospiraceae bacterium]
MRIYVSSLHGKNGSQRVRELLSYGYREMYGESMPEMYKTEKGKPYFPSRPDVCFSLSHTDTHVMCVIADSPVGCDIQNFRQVSERIVQRTCTEKELEVFGFFQLWTLKESWIKLNGSLDREIKTIEFAGTLESVIPPKPAVRARLFQLDGCIAAVCTSGNSLPCSVIEVENI